MTSLPFKQTYKLVIYFFLTWLTSCLSIQKPDNRFDVRVNPIFLLPNNPQIIYDEAHLNTHKAAGTYKPFIHLLNEMGAVVSVNRKPFSYNNLQGKNLLIICNAKSDKTKPRDIGAYTSEERGVINNWVEKGGSLLLIADHHPFGLANKALASSFGVEMNGGSVTDRASNTKKNRGQLEFTHQNKLLGEHPIINGFRPEGKINKVVTFTGQSLKGKSNTTSLLKLGKNTTEIQPDSVWVQNGKNFISFTKPIAVEGLSQAIALSWGKGKVVILGEAAMITAQKSFGRKFGMNTPNSDNKQFAINIIHWLTQSSH